MGRQSCGCELTIGGNSTNDEFVVGCVERVLVRGNVVLELIIAPPMGAQLMLEVVRDGGRPGEGRLPVCCRGENRPVGWYWRCVWLIWVVQRGVRMLL